MDIENEWENFLICDDTRENEIITEKETHNIKHIPKCSPIYISTKTNIAYFNNQIDLYEIFWKIDIIDYYDNSNGIIKKQMKFNSLKKEELEHIEHMYEKESKYKTTDVITHIDTSYSTKGVFKDVRKISIGISKKDVMSYRTKKKSAFYNCFVLILRLFNSSDNTFKEVHMKIFNTGKIEVPGIQDDEMFYKSVDYIRDMLSKYYENINYSKNEIETVLINSNFTCGYLVNREKLFDVLIKKYKIQSLYDPCSYPGVQSKYIINDDVSGKEITLSFMIFRTGSVLIVGKCEKKHLIIVYEFLKNIFENEYENINQNDTTTELIKEKVKRQNKQRKKIIIRN